MKKVILYCLLLFGLLVNGQNYTIVLHGGAGNGIKQENIDKEKAAEYALKMEEALIAGSEILMKGGKAEEAVIAVISVLEDSPLFNAGRGAVFTYDEKNEMDASIMRGSDLNAGAVAGVDVIKNPILAAYEVMVNSPHVLLSREGAVQFAEKQDLDLVSPEYFESEERRQSLQRYKKSHGALSEANWADTKMGTVGCVVLDSEGNLAAGTSTGGMTGKRFGRIGDSPLIGAGTYANNNTCAVSCTGHGEYFIRYAVAHDMSARMAYGQVSVQQAAQTIIQEVLREAGGDGGLIAVDADGNIAMEFNTSGMFRAYLREGEEPVVLMFEEEG